MKKSLVLLTAMLSFAVCADAANDGHELWLSMERNAAAASVTVEGKPLSKNNIVQTAAEELRAYWKGDDVVMALGNAYVGDDGFCVVRENGRIRLTARNASGLLYGAYDMLRKQQQNPCGKALLRDTMYRQTPANELRILNHWDNPNGTVERGYAGRSIFWKENGMADLTVIKDYGRANASVGINAAVLNNVNAKPLMLSRGKLQETKRIADALRPYGIKVFLSVNFASPKVLGGLPTADPLDAKVRQWWQRKVKEIYRMIPDFGGFLVKANSEGEPGPMDYGRSHADGANMLADALKPYDGIVMWRAFVYSPSGDDRASQAYDEFMPYDGQFRDNVIIQIKNGPIDFQPREPASPLFFSMKKTSIMPELQITQEYLGESIHACFLATMWREFFDTLAPYSVKYDAIAGVANIGDSHKWCGSDMAQANWYAFGRMAWDEDLTAETVAKEWTALTFHTDSEFVERMSRMMCSTRESVVKYMMPLGLHHIFAGGHHYGPEPWCDPQGWREDWKPKYYHKASAQGIGFNRTDKPDMNGRMGSGNTRQYPDALYELYNNVETCPEPLLLWFHHLPWNHRMHSGETLWEALCRKYDEGVREAEAYVVFWNEYASRFIKDKRWADQQRLFIRQAKDAWWWRDACLMYFAQFSKQELPFGCPSPRYDYSVIREYVLDMDNYSAADIDRLPEMK